MGILNCCIEESRYTETIELNDSYSFNQFGLSSITKIFL